MYFRVRGGAWMAEGAIIVFLLMLMLWGIQDEWMKMRNTKGRQFRKRD